MPPDVLSFPWERRFPTAELFRWAAGSRSSLYLRATRHHVAALCERRTWENLTRRREATKKDIGYPSDDVVGNDDAGTSDEDNDPYNSPDNGKLVSVDGPTSGIKHTAGALNDTLTLKIQFREFARLDIGGKWYRISDWQLWRFHQKFKKTNLSEATLGVDLNSDSDTNDTVAGWSDDGSVKDLTNNDW